VGDGVAGLDPTGDRVGQFVIGVAVLCAPALRPDSPVTVEHGDLEAAGERTRGEIRQDLESLGRAGQAEWSAVLAQE